MINESPVKIRLKVSQLMTIRQALELKKYVKARAENVSVHNSIMSWLDTQPKVMENFRTYMVLKAFGAYFLEMHLKLS